MLRVPILMYHWFERPGSGPSRGPQFAIKPQDFRRQMEWLAASGRSAVTVGELVAALGGGPPLPASPVVITFDDGYDDFHDEAVGVLSELSLKSTLYVISGLVGKSNLWDQARGEPPRSIMSWQRLRAVAAAGVEIGAHSVSHADLRKLTPERLREECVKSRQELEAGLGRAVSTFAYPFGYFDERVKAAAREAGYTAACAVLLKPLDMLRSDRFALMRAIVHATKSFENFKLRVRLAAPLHRAA